MNKTSAMWVPEFLKIAGRRLATSFGASVAEALSGLNGDKIYVENIRSALDVSEHEARDACEVAVHEGLFKRGVEVLCPDGAVAASAASEAELPVMVNCWVDDVDGQQEREFPTDALRSLVFYSLNGQEMAATTS